MRESVLTTVIVIIATSVALPLKADKFIVWTELGGKIQKANADGTGSISTLYQVNRPRGITVNILDNQIIWTNDEGSRSIQTGSFDGNMPVMDVLIGIVGPNYGITFDSLKDQVFYTEGSNNAMISSINMNGTNQKTLYTSANGLYYPTAVALDRTEKKLYVADAGDRKIKRYNVNGKGSWETLVSTSNGPTDIALDLSAKKMYWAFPYGHAIQRSNLDGSNIETVLGRTHAYQPEGIALDINEQKIYYTDVYNGEILRANLDGSNVETLYTNLSGPTKIAFIPESSIMTFLLLGVVSLRLKGKLQKHNVV